jgi:viologen exporter family transport system permease protein
VKIRNLIRALPTLLRVGFAGTVAYRAEMLVWVLATTMPLIMLALWSAVALESPVGRYGQPQLVAYFLATFIVRQITGSWVFYEISFEIRNGTLGMRLLRPIHPLIVYAVESIAAMPLRILVAVPVAVTALVIVGPSVVTHDAKLWCLWVAATAGAWMITLLVNLIVGCMSFFVESSMKLMDAWLVFFFVLSGYLIPIDLFPRGLRLVVDWLPFRYQLGLPVELMIGVHTPRAALALVAQQWAWVFVGLGAIATLWRRGLHQFAAYGG